MVTKIRKKRYIPSILANFDFVYRIPISPQTPQNGSSAKQIKPEKLQRLLFVVFCPDINWMAFIWPRRAFVFVSLTALSCVWAMQKYFVKTRFVSFRLELIWLKPASVWFSVADFFPSINFGFCYTDICKFFEHFSCVLFFWAQFINTFWLHRKMKFRHEPRLKK